MKYVLKIIIIVLIGIVTYACDSHKKEENNLEQLVEKNRKAAIKQVPPLPKFDLGEKITFKTGFNPFTYTLPQAQQLRQDSREKGPLEQYPIDGLNFSGVVGDRGSIEAVFITPDGYFHRGKVGDYIGKENGRIIKIDAEGIVEITQPKTTFSGAGVNEKIILKHSKE